MKYAILNFLLGSILLGYGIALGGWGWLLGWLGLCFMTAGIAYQRRNPRLYGKRADGTLPLWSWLAFLPLLTYTHLIWHLLRILSREPIFGKVTDTIYVGRRPLGHELPTSVRIVVDLTAEFREVPAIVAGRDYRSFPMLDATTPDPAKLQAFIQSLPDGPIYIHCAQGHGRTGLFALIFLKARGLCSSLEEARSLLASARPLLRLNREQEQFVAQHFGSYPLEDNWRAKSI